jgi:hypothetical protein
MGKLVQVVVRDPTRALHLVSAAASALAAWPLGWVARAWAASVGAQTRRATEAGCATAALWTVTPMAWVTGGQIVSDPLGLLCGATVLALCIQGERSGPRSWMAAAALAGVLVGVRVVDATMLAPIAWKAWRARRERWWSWPAPLALLAGLLAGALPWALWLVAREGVVLVGRGEYHVQGHFQRWGHSTLTDPHPLTRPLRALRTFTVYGLGMGLAPDAWPRLAVTGAWLAVFVAAVRSRWRSPVARLVMLWGTPQVLYLVLAHDVDYPRYLMPAVAMACLTAGLAVTRAGRVGAVAVALAVGAMLAVSLPLADQKRREPPVMYAAARFLARQPRAAVVVADMPSLPLFLSEEAPGVAWLAAPASEIARWQARWEAEGRTVFATAPPAPDPTGWRPVAHYCQDPLLNPRPPRELWLFAPAPAADATPPPACGEELP